MPITSIQMAQLTDKLAASYYALKGTAAANLGHGVGGVDTANYGASTSVYQLGKLIIGGSYKYGSGSTGTFTGYKDADVAAALMPAIVSLQSSFTAKTSCAPFNPVFTALASLVVARGLTNVGGINDYLSYNNVSGLPSAHTTIDDGSSTSNTNNPFNLLVNPYFAELYNNVTGQTLSAWNVFAPVDAVHSGTTLGNNTTGVTGLAIATVATSTIAAFTAAGTATSTTNALAGSQNYFANNQATASLFANPADATASTLGFGIDGSKYAGGTGAISFIPTLSGGSFAGTISVAGYWRSGTTGKLYLGTGTLAPGTYSSGTVYPLTVPSGGATGDLLLQVTQVTISAGINAACNFVVEAYTPTGATNGKPSATGETATYTARQLTPV